MPITQQHFIHCDRCLSCLRRDPLSGEFIVYSRKEMATGFDGERQASRAAEKAGWYVDALTIRCPEHWPQVGEDDD